VETSGIHLIIEYWRCDRALLFDVGRLEKLMRRAAAAAGVSVIESLFHPFASGGTTGILLLEESHLSIHTWPERGYAAVDLYTCGAGDPRMAHGVLEAGLKAERAEVLVVHRGAPIGGSLLTLGYAQHERPSGGVDEVETR
jgi:S-adenosylmethionine decarboxylase